MAKQHEFVVKITRIIGQRGVLPQDQKDEVLELQVTALSLKGAIARAMKDKPEWFDTSIGQIEMMVFALG